MYKKKKRREPIPSYTNSVPYSKRLNVLFSLLPVLYLINPLTLSANAAIAIFSFNYMLFDTKKSTNSPFFIADVILSTFVFFAYFTFLVFFNRLIRHIFASGNDPTKNIRESLFEMIEEKQLEIAMQQSCSSKTTDIKNMNLKSFKGRLAGLSKKTSNVRGSNLLFPITLGIPFGLLDSINTVTSIKILSHFIKKPMEAKYIAIISSIATVIFILLSTHNLMNYYSNVYGLEEIKKSLNQLTDIQHHVESIMNNNIFYTENRMNLEIECKDFLNYLIKNHPNICRQIEICLEENGKNSNEIIQLHMTAIWLQYIASKRKEVQDEEFNIIFPETIIPSIEQSSSLFSEGSDLSENFPLLSTRVKEEKVLNAKNIIGCIVDGVMQWPILLHTIFVWLHTFNVNKDDPILFYLILILASIPPTFLQLYHSLYPLFYWSKTQERKDIFSETNKLLNIASQNQLKLKTKYKELLEQKHHFIQAGLDWEHVAKKIADEKKTPLNHQQTQMTQPSSKWYYFGKTLKTLRKHLSTIPRRNTAHP